MEMAVALLQTVIQVAVAVASIQMVPQILSGRIPVARLM